MEKLKIFMTRKTAHVPVAAYWLVQKNVLSTGLA